jgi:hypothetical protein
VDFLTCRFAASNGHLQLLQWAQQNGCRSDEHTCSQAALNGHLSVLQWAHLSGCPWDEKTCSLAARSGHLEILPMAVHGIERHVAMHIEKVMWQCCNGHRQMVVHGDAI